MPNVPLSTAVPAEEFFLEEDEIPFADFLVFKRLFFSKNPRFLAGPENAFSTNPSAGMPALSKARELLPKIVNQVAYGSKHIIFTRRGKKIAAVVSIEELEFLEAIEDRIDIEDSIKALKDIKKNGSLDWNKVKSDFEI